MRLNVGTNMLETKYPAGSLVIVDIPARTVHTIDMHCRQIEKHIPRYTGLARVQHRTKLNERARHWIEDVNQSSNTPPRNAVTPVNTWNGGICWVVLEDGFNTRVICHADEVVGVA